MVKSSLLHQREPRGNLPELAQPIYCTFFKRKSLLSQCKIQYHEKQPRVSYKGKLCLTTTSAFL